MRRDLFEDGIVKITKNYAFSVPVEQYNKYDI